MTVKITTQILPYGHVTLQSGTVGPAGMEDKETPRWEPGYYSPTEQTLPPVIEVPLNRIEVPLQAAYTD